MSSSPDSPRLLRGGLVLVDPGTGNVLRIIALQYNPDTMTRSLQIRGVVPAVAVLVLLRPNQDLRLRWLLRLGALAPDVRRTHSISSKSCASGP